MQKSITHESQVASLLQAVRGCWPQRLKDEFPLLREKRIHRWGQHNAIPLAYTSRP
jgi:hypothetical protein